MTQRRKKVFVFWLTHHILIALFSQDATVAFTTTYNVVDKILSRKIRVRNFLCIFFLSLMKKGRPGSKYKKDKVPIAVNASINYPVQSAT